MWKILLDCMDVIYLLALIGVAFYSLNNLLSVALFLRLKDHPRRRRNKTPPAEWPRVTVQLPIYNERYTIERLIDSVINFDYPRDRLQIQVLDDSTDDTVDLVRRLVTSYASKGYDIQLIHRAERSGFKAGALREGLKTAKGELIAIFDADFTPPADWLKKAVSRFSDPHLGCLQTRWGHLNDKFSPLTRGQSLGIDGHFMVEQTVRSRYGLFMNFNGTAGLWRKACIDDAGGWQVDTLTEDLDLSYRAQLHGWKFDYAPELVVPAELPAQVEAFKQQQFRWAKGSFQTLKKLAPALLRARTPLYRRFMGFVHLSGYLIHLLMIVTVLLMLPVGYFTPQVFRWMPWTLIAGFGPPLLYLVSATEHLPRLSDRLRLLPVLMLLGLGLSLNNALAILEGLFSKGHGTFVRTPKFNLLDQKGNWTVTPYAIPVSRMTWVELGLGCYALLSSVILGIHIGVAAMPWILVYAVSFFYIAGLSFSQNTRLRRLHTDAAVG
ncbi:MAG: cellulose synthase family protein [Anaerolineales bacterium]|jgi:cellulose synthase/poly-beta-1,6-N-acetylglucosamine synthase-like glycosyltransferase